MKRILILGASGLVGRALLAELKNNYCIYGTYHSRPVDLPAKNALYLDIADLNNLYSILSEASPQILISCLTGDYTKQMLLHKEIAEYTKDTAGRLYYCSTANVFDNDVTSPHYEDDRTNSASDYGRFKIKCENQLQDILGKKAVILRLPMIWGKDSPRYNKLLNDLKGNVEVEVYSNLYKTSNIDLILARQIHYIINNNMTGIFHLATDDVVNYEYFVRQLIKQAGYDHPSIVQRKLTPDPYYLALLSNRRDLPGELRISHQDVINLLSR